MQTSFESLGLSGPLLEQVKLNGFQSPTPVQEQAIPAILDSKDVLAQAKTGSGKTAAFVLPLIQKLLNDNGGQLPETKSAHAPVVIISPTRELAQQTFKVSMTFGKELGLKCSCIIGGETFEGQKKDLKEGVHFLVATPGRLLDLYKQKLIHFQDCFAVALDEADRLFDMGFKDDIRYLLSKIKNRQQLLMFSATNNIDVLNTAYAFKADPQEIKVNVEEFVVNKINQTLYHVGQGEKVPLLVGILKTVEEPYGIVFCNTQSETHVLATWLQNLELGLNVKAISGKLPQAKRTKLMKDFREKKINLLISTDVAARGLDIDNINLVINYDLPQDPSNYVHRIGRTGRAGRDGKAISFCAFEDCEFLGPIESYMKDKIPVGELEDEMFAEDVGKRPRIEKAGDRGNDSSRGKDMSRNNNRSRRDGGKREGGREDRNSRNKSNRQQTRGNSSRSERPDDSRGRNRGRDRDRNKNRNERNDKGRDRRNEKQAKPSLPRNSATITSKSLADAQNQAMAKLNIDKPELLKHEVVKKGRKAFFFFGPQEVTYNFFINPNYEILARTFLDKVIEIMKLEVSHMMSSDANELMIDFVGNDEKFLSDNGFEMLEAFDHLLKKHLGKVAGVDKNFKLTLKVAGESNSKESKLEALADRMAKKALEKNEPVILGSMSPKERRIVHQFLNQNPNVKTESLGDGYYKKIQINPSPQ